MSNGSVLNRGDSPKKEPEMPNYNIRVLTPKLCQVRGYPVSCPELPYFHLFVHRPYGQDHGWNISEAKTGVAMIEDCFGTRKQTMDMLRIKLLGMTAKGIDPKLVTQLVIDGQVAKYGIANKEAKHE